MRATGPVNGGKTFFLAQDGQYRQGSLENMSLVDEAVLGHV